MRKGRGRSRRSLVGAGAVLAGAGLALAAGGVLGSANPAPALRTAALTRAPQEADATGRLLDGLRGTPPVACELVLHGLESRWGGSSVRPRVHPPLGPTPEEAGLAEAAWSGSLGPESVPTLLAGLSSPDDCVRRAAARLLGTVRGAELGEPLLEMLAGADPAGRLAAVMALSRVGSEEAVEGLVAALEGGDGELRRAAAWALGIAPRIGREGSPDRTLAALNAALGDPDAGLRENAAWALGRRGGRAAVPPLSAALADASPGVRINAAWALGQIEDAASIPALVALLGSDGDEQVRQAAAWALGQIDG